MTSPEAALALVTLADSESGPSLAPLLEQLGRDPGPVTRVLVLDAGMSVVDRARAALALPSADFVTVDATHYAQFAPLTGHWSALWLESARHLDATPSVLWPVDARWSPGALSARGQAPDREPRHALLLPPSPAADFRVIDDALDQGREERGIVDLLGNVCGTARGEVRELRVPVVPPRDLEAEAAELDAVVAEAEQLIADADFGSALETLQRAVRMPGGMRSSVVFLLSRVLRALSRYEEAKDVLLLCQDDVLTTSRARAEEAEIAWIQHDYAGGIEAATHALRINLMNRKAEITLKRCTEPLTPVRGAAEVVPSALSHVAFYVSARGNFGDVALPVAVRSAVESVGADGPWVSVHAHQVFDEERLEIVNATGGLVVGGGGLFLPDTSPNGNSGWQWNVPRENLDRLTVPLGVIAVGYNLFEGQAFTGSLFHDNLVALVERATVVGLRNHGSVGRVREALPERLQEKISFLPCPTTVLSHIDRDLPEKETGTGRVLFNAAYDRSERRFRGGYEAFLAEMATFVRGLRAAGSDLSFVAHLPSDERFVRDIETSHGITMDVEPLYDMTLREGYGVYRRSSLVIGMRGHASMIPFGLGTPVLSVISHPKMRFFLEDIERPEWGFTVGDDGMGDAMLERTLDVLAREDAYRADVASIQGDLLQHVQGGAKSFLSAVRS